MSQTITPIEKLVAEALDDGRCDNGQTRQDWCEKFGLDPHDVSRNADAYLAEQSNHYLREGVHSSCALLLAARDLFLYGLLLGRHLP